MDARRLASVKGAGLFGRLSTFNTIQAVSPCKQRVDKAIKCKSKCRPIIINMTWIDLVSKCPAQVTHCDAFVILIICASRLDS